MLRDCERLRTGNFPLDQLNAMRGRCAEQLLIRRLCESGHDVRNQVRVRDTGGSSVLDVSPFPGARRRLPAGIEVKHINAPSYRGPAGAASLAARATEHVHQVRLQMARSAPGLGGITAPPGLPSRVRLMYMLDGPMTDTEFRNLSRAIYGAVRAANAVGAPPVAVTVVRASRFRQPSRRRLPLLPPPPSLSRRSFGMRSGPVWTRTFGLRR
jgi:hypothetical protein